MSKSPRRLTPDPLISRQYEPSRLQLSSLISAYALAMPIISRRLSPARGRSSEPGGADARVSEPRSSIAGA